MPHRHCRKSSAIFLCGLMCLYLWQASVYPVIAMEKTKSTTSVNNNISNDSVSETTQHVVERGETLWDLAGKYHTTVKVLVNLNQIKSADQIGEGQIIRVPSQETPAKVKTPRPTDIPTYVETVPLKETEVKPAETVKHTSWWLNILRSIPIFATVSKQSSQAANSAGSLSAESKIQTYDFYVNKDIEQTENPPLSDLNNIAENHSELVSTKSMAMNNEDQVLSRSLGYLVTKEDVELLSRVIYGEARGEDFLGQVAVGAVVLNRLKDPRFPKTIRSIVYQNGAFTAVDDQQIHLDPDDQAYKAAEAALSGLDPTNGAIFYYNPRLATDRWIKSRPVIKRIGNHTFSI